jgi:hypothetical protein
MEEVRIKIAPPPDLWTREEVAKISTAELILILTKSAEYRQLNLLLVIQEINRRIPLAK